METLEQDQYDTLDGWRVVVAAAMTQFVYLGVIYSWGALQDRLTETAACSLTTLTFVGSLATSFMISISIPALFCVRRYGNNRTALVGAFLMGLGEFSASWVTTHIVALFFLHGIVFGIGGGLSIFACSTAPLDWFKRHRGLAVGIVFGGGSLGAAVMSVAATYLARKLDIAWTFRIIGITAWGICVPLSFYVQQPKKDETKKFNLQWDRFREKKFLVLLVGLAIACFPLFIPPYFVPTFARSESSSRDSALTSLAVWNVASTIGRVSGGFTADHLLGPLNSLMTSIFLTGISSLAIWPFASNLAVLYIFIIWNGIGCGSFFSLVPPVLGQVFGPQNTLEILPIVWETWFFGFFFGTPIAASLYDSAGIKADISEYRPAMFYTGAMSLGGLIFVTALRFVLSQKIFMRI